MRELLEREAQALGISLTSEQLDQFERYAEELTEWNETMNLTAITDPEGIAVRHFADSLSGLLALSPAPESGPDLRLADIGAGAGFPGLPLLLARPSLRLTLIEATGKKASFVRHVVELLGLKGVEVLTGRAEDLARDKKYRETFDAVTARAVAALPTLTELTLPFVRTGGHVVVWKKAGIDAEIASASRALAAVGGRISDERRLRLTGDEGERMLLTLEKTHPTPAAFPRRAGIPAKTPL
ncbi:MAG: 16S rRNA (guanine(527)-N(7))-methyltransferase RsmG [Chloroflexi bacterium]|nr:16S rRNA (guanine(527)-N(7))-methyltransferase RsmG [Chloroflexota bacterium]